MCVRGAIVRGPGDDGWSEFIRDVVDGEGIFVVSVADFATDVFGIWTAVDEALGIVDIPSFTSR
jgi:hypothetical protein